MKYVRDNTGRFSERPHYEPHEIDGECERIITEFLRRANGRITWPVTTDDLTKLIEQHVEDLDLYADLSGLGSEVEGVTDFRPGRRPRVRIAAPLSDQDYRSNRLRTTLTHEFGHVHFHKFLFDVGEESLELFGPSRAAVAPTGAQRRDSHSCRRQSILDAPKIDWMEWQAGYACGAFLMPAGPVREAVHEFHSRGRGYRAVTAGSPEGIQLIAEIANRFDASRDAARVRLLKLSLLATGVERSIFE